MNRRAELKAVAPSFARLASLRLLCGALTLALTACGVTTHSEPAALQATQTQKAQPAEGLPVTTIQLSELSALRHQWAPGYATLKARSRFAATSLEYSIDRLTLFVLLDSASRSSSPCNQFALTEVEPAAAGAEVWHVSACSLSLHYVLSGDPARPSIAQGRP